MNYSIILSPEKLDPNGPAYEKFERSKKYDAKKRSLVMVLNDKFSGNFAVDTAEIKDATMYAETDVIGKRIEKFLKCFIHFFKEIKLSFKF